jgi:hypothetical protein
MPPLYIVQQGAKIRVRNSRLQVEMEDESDPQLLVNLPLSHVSEVVRQNQQMPARALRPYSARVR